jgi:putative inorganic carbon (hco3(-)) transporter
MAKSRRTSHRPARPSTSAKATTGTIVIDPQPAAKPSEKPRPQSTPARSAPTPGGVSLPLVIGAGLTVLWALLWVIGALSTFGLALFMIGLSWAAIAVVRTSGDLWDATDPLRSARRIGAFVVVVALPVTFDPGTAERYGVAKFSVLMIGALVLALLWIVDAITNTELPDLRTGLHWPILAMVVVGVLATIFSVNPRLSLVGAYQSYDGLLALASFAVVALIAAESWRVADLRRILTVFLLASGGLVILYGLIQTADVELGTSWDWIHFVNAGASFGPTSTVWSTFGNPNHFAGFVAAMLPIGVIVAISDRSVWVRALSGVVLLGGLVCLVETSSLGGLAAAVGALALTAILLIPELRGRRTLALWCGAGLVVAVGIAFVIVGAQGTISRKLDAITQWSSGTSTAAQRVQYWHSAVDMAKDRPILGWGPDTFGYLAPTYQTQKFVDAFGPNQVINAAHNTFLETLATKGVLGLGALLFFLAWLALRAIGAWRNTRARERTDEGWREHRLMLTAALGAAVGVLLQNSFNVELLGINIVLWAMAGVVSVVALSVGVPVGLNPARIVRVTPFDETASPEPARQPNRRQARRSGAAVPLAIGAVVVVALAWFSSTWWRADRSYQAAIDGTVALTSGKLTSSAAQTRVVNSTLRHFDDATKENTSESRYALSEANFILQTLAATNALTPENVTGLAPVRTMLQTAVDRGPRDPVPLSSYARLLARLRELAPGSGDPKVEAALFARAARANPFEPSFVAGEATAKRAAGDLAGARAAVDNGLTRFPEDKTLLTEAVATAKAQNDTAAADGFQARLDALSAG